MEAMDLIERRMGLGAIRFGHSGSAARWRPSGAFRSPHYTTRWARYSGREILAGRFCLAPNKGRC